MGKKGKETHSICTTVIQKTSVGPMLTEIGYFSQKLDNFRQF
jgi:hypothetical protein